MSTSNYSIFQKKYFYIFICVFACLLIHSCFSSTVVIGHPRIWLDSSTLAALQAKYSDNTAEWKALKTAADRYAAKSVDAYRRDAYTNNIYYAYQGSGWKEAVLTLATAYKASGNTTYAAKVREIIDVMNAAGQAPVAVDSGYPTRHIPVAMAIAYDWLYDYLDTATKAKMRSTMSTWFSWVTLNAYMYKMTSDKEYDHGVSNYFAGHILGMGLCGLAIADDDPALSNSIITQTNNLWDQWVVPAFTTGALQSGYPNEGSSYGQTASLWLLQYALAYKTATGTDLMADYGDRLAFGLLYQLKPNTWQVSNEGDQSGSYSGISASSLPLFLSKVLPGINGNYMAYLYANAQRSPYYSNEDTPQNISKWQLALWHDVTKPQTNYNTLPLYYRSLGDEHIFARTDWTTGATWVSFNGGTTYRNGSSNHQQRSGGHIDLVRGSDSLLVLANQWKGTDGVYGNPYQETPASNGTNTLFFNDGTSTNYNYDGGQTNRGTTRILKYEGTINYLYEKTDLTRAYSPGLNYFHRNFVTPDNGSTIVVYDRIKTNLPSYIKRLQWYLHPSATNSAISNGVMTSTYGKSRLHLATIYPASPGMTLNTSPTYNSYGTIKTMNAKRIEVTGNISSTTFNPLTVLLATNSSTATPLLTRIDTASMQGVVIVSAIPKVVIFSKDGTQQNSVTYTASYSSSATGNHVLLDMEPAMYDIHRDGSLINTGVMASTQGVLYFSATGGTQFQIVKAGSAPVFSDTEAPVASIFTMPTTSNSLTVGISSLTSTEIDGRQNL